MHLRLQNSLQRQWRIADSLKLEVGGIIRENIAITITTGKEKEVIPECSQEYRFDTFHTHPFHAWMTDRSYIEELGLIEFPSGPDVSQLLGCNDKRYPIERTEHIVGQNGVISVHTSAKLIRAFRDMQPNHKRAFVKTIEEYAAVLNILVQLNLLKGTTYLRRMRTLKFIDLNNLVKKILADPEVGGKDELRGYLLVFGTDRWMTYLASYPAEMDGFDISQVVFPPVNK